MYSLRHVFWRGAMALSLLALGIGGGFGFQQAPLQASQAPACEHSHSQVRQIDLVVEKDALAVRDEASASRG